MVHFLGRTVRQLRLRPIMNIQLKKNSGKGEKTKHVRRLPPVVSKPTISNLFCLLTKQGSILLTAVKHIHADTDKPPTVWFS